MPDWFGYALTMLVQLVIVVAYVSRLGTRVSHCEKGMGELWDGHNNHETEIRSLGRIEGKVDALLMIQQKK